MYFYARLLQSMLKCFDHIHLRRAPVYTLSMAALGVAVCLNILTIIDLLWTCGVLADPYHSAGALRPRHYLCATVSIAFIGNTVLARLAIRAGGCHLPDPSFAQSGGSALAAPMYILASAILFLITLGLNSLNPG